MSQNELNSKIILRINANLNNVRCEARRHFRNKKKAYLKIKIEDPETKSKIKNLRDLYRGISDFKKGYQPRNNIVKNKTDDLVTGIYSILARWRDYFSQLLNVHGVHDVRQTETHTAEPLVPLKLSWLLISLKVTNHQVLIRSQQN